MKHRRLLRHAFAFMVVSAVLATSADFAMACSCGALNPPEKEFKDATAVFVGTAVNIEQPATRAAFVSWIFNLLGLSNPPSVPMIMRNRKVTFEAHKAWKGLQAADVTVSTSMGYCGYEFKVGEEYLVYAPGGSILVTSQCLRTRPVVEAAEDLTFLHTLPELVMAPAAVRHDWRPARPYIVGAIGALLALILGAEWYRKRSAVGQ